MASWGLAKRSLRHWWQRRTRGWDDSDTWSLDISLARWILPRLRRFKELKTGYPGTLTPEQWDARLDKMIRAFELIAADNSLFWTGPEADEVKQGMKQFHRWYFNLWW